MYMYPCVLKLLSLSNSTLSSPIQVQLDKILIFWQFVYNNSLVRLRHLINSRLAHVVLQ